MSSSDLTTEEQMILNHIIRNLAKRHSPEEILRLLNEAAAKPEEVQVTPNVPSVPVSLYADNRDFREVIAQAEMMVKYVHQQGSVPINCEDDMFVLVMKVIYGHDFFEEWWNPTLIFYDRGR